MACCEIDTLLSVFGSVYSQCLSETLMLWTPFRRWGLLIIWAPSLSGPKLKPRLGNVCHKGLPNEIRL